MPDWYRLVRPLLFTLPEEIAHAVTLTVLKAAYHLHLFPRRQFSTPVEAMGLTFPNPIGLAAGIDKDARYVLPLSALGVGFIEAGSVTPDPRVGNPKPRLFRLVQHEALINRMGFAGAGVDAACRHLRGLQFPMILGVNIASNKDSQGAQMIQDYQVCFDKVAPYADYVTLDISCPHEASMSALELDDIKRMLEAMKLQQTKVAAGGKHIPLVLKLSPDMSEAQWIALAEQMIAFEIEGVIAGNSSNQRPGQVSTHPRAGERGGLTGSPLYPNTLKMIKLLNSVVAGKVTIVGCGGIDSRERAREIMAAGAALIQIYTPLVYHGPRIIPDLVKGANANEIKP